MCDGSGPREARMPATQPLPPLPTSAPQLQEAILGMTRDLTVLAPLLEAEQRVALQNAESRCADARLAFMLANGLSEANRQEIAARTQLLERLKRQTR